MNNPWNLPQREADVLTCIAGGAWTTKDAGEKMGLSPKTVELYVSRAMSAMNAGNRLHAVVLWDRANREAAS